MNFRLVSLQIILISMVAYFCHHLWDDYVDLSGHYIDLSGQYIDLSGHYIDLSGHYVDLSEKYHRN